LTVEAFSNFISAQRTMPNESYLPVAVHELKRLKGLADASFAQLSAEQLFAELAPGDNSIAVIVKHVSGNMRSRFKDFLTTDGEKPDRNRDGEFEVSGADTREALLHAWDQAWTLLFAELGALNEEDLSKTVRVRGEEMTALQAISRQLSHYAYHIGQIVYVAKHLAGAHWKTLSVPRGQSAQFNRSPTPYNSRR
jgi:hypothetical protein